MSIETHVRKVLLGVIVASLKLAWQKWDDSKETF